MVDRESSKALATNEEIYYGNDKYMGNLNGASIPSTSSGNDFVEIMPQPKKKKTKLCSQVTPISIAAKEEPEFLTCLMKRHGQY